MALEVKRQTIETQRTIGDPYVQIPVRAEAIVPGAGRERVNVLMDEARLSIGNVDVQTDRVVADGTVSMQALYRLGEDGEISALEASAPLSRAVDLPGAAEGMSCLYTGTVEHVETGYENGHIVFHAVVGLRLKVLDLQKEEIATALEGEEGIEQKTQELTSLKLSAESSAQALLEGDARMPPVLDARTALMDWGSVRLDDVSADLGGIRVSGSVQAEALIGSGVPGRPVALVKYSLPFKQLVDLPEWLCKNVEARAQLSSLNAQLRQAEDGGTNLHFDAQVDIAVQAMGEDSVTVLADAYGVGPVDIACEYDPLTFCSASAPVSHRDTVRANLLLPEGAPSVGTIVAVRARPQIGSVEPAGAGAEISGVLETRALYLASGSGALCSVKDDLPFTISCPFLIGETDDIELEVESADASALMSDRMEVSCALRLSGTHREEETVRKVASAQAVPAQKKPFSVVLYWPSQEESLWEIGRRYRVPEERLAAFNANRTAAEPLVVRG
ncbi:MAG: DUF3794 domain-containing protein [Clostridia bacterium]|nr:DUF3794 domain-containing protein [Clostridia bacterium]